MFGLLDRFGGKKRKEERARNKELAGDLDAAIALFMAAECAGEVARLLLLKADGEADPNQRMVLCAQAARVGAGTAHGSEAAKRKAVLAYDLIKGTQGAKMQGELLRAAAELEAVGAWELAVEAYVAVGDTEAEIRVLKEAGAIERLEDRLQATSQEARRERDRAQLLRRMRDLDAIGERREALRCARQWLERGHDDQIQLEMDRVSHRLISGPIALLDLHGAPTRIVLGTEVTVGRARADIIVASTAISRQHLRLFRRDGAAYAEDLDTRNGTTLSGARVRGALAIGDGLELELAGRVPCKLSPTTSPEAVRIEMAGEVHLAPLGPLRIGVWQLVDAHDGEDRFIVLRTPDGAQPPHMGNYRLGFQIELCIGDEIREQRDGRIVLAVPDPSRPTMSIR